MISAIVTSILLGTPTCGDLRQAYRNSSCCPLEGGEATKDATCPSGCIVPVTGLVPVTEEQYGYHSYVDILPEVWDATTDAASRSTVILRINTPVRPHDDQGAEMPVFLGINRGGTTIPPNWRDFEALLFPTYFRPLRPMPYWDVNKRFPVIIFSNGGGSGMEDPAVYPNENPQHFDIAQRRPFKDDFIFVTVMHKKSNERLDMEGYKRMVDFLIQNVPQIDTSRISMWGASSGGGEIMQYAARYGTSGGVTHGVLFGPGFPGELENINKTLSNLTNVPTFPMYVIANVGDQVARDMNAKYLSKLASIVPNIHITLLDALTEWPSGILNHRYGPLFFTTYQNSNWGETNHYLLNLLQVFDEGLASVFTVKDDPFPPASNGGVTAFRIDSPGTGYHAGDTIWLVSPSFWEGGKAMTLMIEPENLDANGGVISVPKITFGGIGMDGWIGVSTALYPVNTIQTSGSGSGLHITVTAAEAFQLPSDWDPATNKPLIDPYDFVLDRIDGKIPPSPPPPEPSLSTPPPVPPSFVPPYQPDFKIGLLPSTDTSIRLYLADKLMLEPEGKLLQGLTTLFPIDLFGIINHQIIHTVVQNLNEASNGHATFDRGIEVIESESNSWLLLPGITRAPPQLRPYSASSFPHGRYYVTYHAITDGAAKTYLSAPKCIDITSTGVTTCDLPIR